MVYTVSSVMIVRRVTKTKEDLSNRIPISSAVGKIQAHP
jgi:hypothetical protein